MIEYIQNLSFGEIIQMISIIIIFIGQIILYIQGRPADALKLETKKEQQIQKLYALRQKRLKQADETNEKIKIIKENKENATNTQNGE